jgi:hypothetical protein
MPCVAMFIPNINGMFLVLSFMFFLQDRRIGGLKGEGWYWWEEGGGREKGSRKNMIQTMYTHVCKCKNDMGQDIGKKRAGENSSVIYLILCKNLCKCNNVPPSA